MSDHEIEVATGELIQLSALDATITILQQVGKEFEYVKIKVADRREMRKFAPLLFTKVTVIIKEAST